jgi:hypothetical protein
VVPKRTILNHCWGGIFPAIVSLLFGMIRTVFLFPTLQGGTGGAVPPWREAPGLVPPCRPPLGAKRPENLRWENCKSPLAGGAVPPWREAPDLVPPCCPPLAKTKTKTLDQDNYSTARFSEACCIPSQKLLSMITIVHNSWLQSFFVILLEKS